MNTNFKVIGLTRLEIKPKSTATEADAFNTRHRLTDRLQQDAVMQCTVMNQFQSNMINNLAILMHPCFHHCTLKHVFAAFYVTACINKRLPSNKGQSRVKPTKEADGGNRRV